MLSVAHNLLSMNIHRNMKNTNIKGDKASSRLSSGYKINSASDDAAGLAISDKMKAQIRGLARAGINIQEGISWATVADGAMQEMNNMLTRMRELCIQAANDTNTFEDRNKLQLEINELIEEIDNVSQYTEFNTIPVFRRPVSRWGEGGGTLRDILGVDGATSANKLSENVTIGSGWDTTGKPWNTDFTTSSSGTLAAPATSTTKADMESYLLALLQTEGINVADLNYSTISALSTNSFPGLTVSKSSNSGITGENIVLKVGNFSFQISYANSKTSNPTLETSYIQEFNAPGGTVIGTRTYTFPRLTDAMGREGFTYGSAWLDFSGFGVDYNVQDLNNKGFNTTCATCTKHYSIHFVNGGGNKYVDSTSYPSLQVDISSATNGKDLADLIMDALKSSTQFSNHFQQYTIDPADPTKLYIYDNRPEYNTYAGNPGGGSSIAFIPLDPEGNAIIDDTILMWIQSGANTDQGLWIKKPFITLDVLGINNVGIRTSQEAVNSLSVCDRASTIINEKRAMVGAYSNRLEHSLKSADVSYVNLSDAESRISNADIAKEAMSHFKAKALMQAGMSMLAQANQQPELVLQLLNRS